MIDSVDRLETLMSGLAGQRGIIGNALTSTAWVTTRLATLLGETRPGIKNTVTNLGRTAEEIMRGEVYVRTAHAPALRFKQLSNLGSYGAWLQIWICRQRLIFGAPGTPQMILPPSTCSVTARAGGRCQYK